jgi:hypothetical protein
MNVASNPKYAGEKSKLAKMLQDYLARTNDPRATGRKVIWDTSPYYGQPNVQLRK